MPFNSCLIFLDGVIIFSKTEKDHVVDVEKVLNFLIEAGVTPKLMK